MTDQPSSANGSHDHRRLGVSPPARPRGLEQDSEQTGPQTAPAEDSSARPSFRSAGPTLDIGGFTQQPKPPEDGSPHPPTTSQPIEEDATSPRRKTTVLLPHRLIDGVRQAAERQDCILAEVIIQAYVAHGEVVRQELVDTEAAKRRKELGLPPPPPPQPPSRARGEERGQLQISISAQALEVLDEAADALGISRSHLIEELLERHLEGGFDATGR